MKPCAIYTRTATESSYSCEAQRETCATLADERGWAVLAERFDDPLCSGFRRQRSGLALLLERVQAGAVGVVLVWRMDRLSRSHEQFSVLRAELQSRGVRLISAAEGDLDSWYVLATEVE
jgi:DNA invertase Pin-like site-specific DNA recombinase